jgi:hypothetical protein
MNKSFVKKTILGAGLFSIAFLGYSAVSTAFSSEPQQIAQSNQYSPNIVKDYLSSCRRSAVDAGLSTADAAKLCDCTIQEFQSRFNESRFRELNRQAQQGNTPDVFTEVGMACYARIS